MRRHAVAAAALGILATACGSGDAASPRSIVFSPGPAEGAAGSGPTSTGSSTVAPSGGGPTSVGEGEPAATSDATTTSQPEPPVDIYLLTNAGNHLDATFQPENGIRAQSGSCPVQPSGYQTIQCVTTTGTAGRFVVWTGRQDSTRGLQGRVYRQDGSLTLVAATVTTLDFESIVLYEGTSGGEAYVLVEYDLDRPGNIHDFDIVTFTDQEEPGPIASLTTLVSPKVQVRSDGVTIEALNYGDGADLCCPNYKDVFTIVRDPERGWLAQAQTFPIR